MTRHQHGKLALLLACVLFLTACGETVFQTLRATTALAPATLDILVNENVINQPEADLIQTDLTETDGCVAVLETDLNGISKESPTLKTDKLNAWVKATRCWKGIAARNHFAGHQRVQRIANLIDGAFAVGVVFYSERGDMRASAEASDAKPVKLDESKLKDDLKAKVKELREAMKNP
jgi:hypothetical protein